MKYQRKQYEEKDFIRIRDFLKISFQEVPNQKNWLIDRWNFTRYFGQAIHQSFQTWPETVGLWEDENNEIVAVVHSQGNRLGENVGEVFFQLSNHFFSDDFLNELINYAESTLYFINDENKFVNIRVNTDAIQLKNLLKARDYTFLDWADPVSFLDLEDKEYQVLLPAGFKIIEANQVSDYDRGFAHGKAFGYYKNDIPDDDDGERAYQKLKEAPDYIPEIDLVVLDENDQIASFVAHWYDDVNKIGILEPVGTIPIYRRMGLAKALIHEGINRVKKLGAEKMSVGSEQQFYQALGFELKYRKEVWHKTLDK